EAKATTALATAEKEAWISAGPIGWVILGLSVALGALGMLQKDATASAEPLKTAEDALTSASEASHGAVDQNVMKTLKAHDAYKGTVDAVGKAGIGQDALNQAVATGGVALDGMRNSLQQTIDAGTTYVKVVGTGKNQITEQSTALAGGTRTLDSHASAARKA